MENFKELLNKAIITPNEEQLMKNSGTILAVSISVLNLLLNYDTKIYNKNLIFGRKKSEASFINNKLTKLYKNIQNGSGELNNSILNDISAITTITHDSPVLVAEEKIPKFSYNGVSIFKVNEPRRKNMIDKYDESGKIIEKRSKDNGYQAYHIELMFNPEFVDSIVDDILDMIDNPQDSKLSSYSEIEIFLQKIMKKHFLIGESIESGTSIKARIKSILSNGWFELQIKTVQMFYDAEFGLASHDAYKKGKLGGIFTQLLNENDSQNVVEKLKMISWIEDESSPEYKVFTILRSNSTGDIKEVLLKAFNYDEEALNSCLFSYCSVLGINSINIEEIRTKINSSAWKDFDNGFYDKLKHYADAIEIDLDTLVSMKTSDIVEGYGIPSTLDHDIAIIRVLKQKTFIKEISLIMRNSKEPTEVIDNLIPFMKKRKKISLSAFKKYCEVLGVREGPANILLQKLKDLIYSKKESDVERKLIDEVKTNSVFCEILKKSQPDFFYISNGIIEHTVNRGDIPAVGVINLMRKVYEASSVENNKQLGGK